MWSMFEVPFRLAVAHTAPTSLDVPLTQRWAAWLLYTPEEVVRPWTPPSDTGWAMMSDVGSFRAGVPEALIQWRRARDEILPDPMI